MLVAPRPALIFLFLKEKEYYYFVSGLQHSGTDHFLRFRFNLKSWKVNLPIASFTLNTLSVFWGGGQGGGGEEKSVNFLDHTS